MKISHPDWQAFSVAELRALVEAEDGLSFSGLVLHATVGTGTFGRVRSIQDARYVIHTITFFCSFVSRKFRFFPKKSAIFLENFCTF